MFNCERPVGDGLVSRFISALRSDRRAQARRRRTGFGTQNGRALEVQTLEDRLLLTIDFDFIYEGEIAAAGIGFEHETEGQTRRDALEQAADQLGSIFDHTATITLYVTSIEDAGSDTLASAGSNFSDTLTDGFDGNEVVRTKILTGTDTNGATADGSVEVNWGKDWGLSADPTQIDVNDFDFSSTIYHELLHAIGFSSTLTEDGRDLRDNDTSGGGTGAWGYFDQFLVDVSSDPVVTAGFSLDAAVYDAGKVGGASPAAGLFFNGTNARNANGGLPVGLYTPTSFEEGSSVSHLDDENSALDGLVMLSATDSGPGARNLSTLERAILTDLGYSFLAGGLSITETDGSTSVSEDATTDTFDVVLTSAPLVDVVLNLSSGDTDEVTVSPATLTFTPDNWDVAQTVTVTGVDDQVSDGHVSRNITISVDDANSDDGYDDMVDIDVAVTILDNEPIILTTDGTANADDIVLNLTGDGEGNIEGVGATSNFTGTDGFVFNGDEGDDTLTINLNGNAIPSSGIVFNGQGGNDKLIVIGSGNEVTVYTPDAATFGNGVVMVGGVPITFTGLEPVDISGMASATLNLPGADDVLTVETGVDYGTGNADALRVSGTSGGVAIETVAFFNNTSVTIDTSTTDGDDTVTITAADNAHGNESLNVITGAGTDSIIIGGDVVTIGNQLYNDAVSLTADVTLTSTTGDVQLTDSVALATHSLNVAAAGNNSLLSSVSGSGGLTFSGSGRTNLFGANSYTGVTDITAGEVWVNDASSLGAAGAASGTSVGDGAELYLTGNDSFAEDLALAGILAVGTTSAPTWSGPIVLSGGSSEFELDQPSDTLTVSGAITGDGGFAKTGLGTLTLSSAANDYTGNTVLSDGTTFVNGTPSTGSDFFVQTGATLGGTGTIGGTLTVQDGGRLAPGNSPGIMSTGALDVQAGSTLDIEIDGITTAGTDYDQIATTGTVTLGGTLNLIDGFAGTGSTGDTILLIDNGSPDPVSGTFDGLPNGADVVFNGEFWRIAYDGGNGNDVVLVNGPAGVSIADVSQDETDSGQTSFVFTVTVDSPVGEAFTVEYSVTQQTASEVDDYVTTSGTLTFGGTSSGETQTIAVTVNGDLQIEDDETFLVTLANIVGSSNVVLTDSEATGTIVNDDFPADVNLSVSSGVATEAAGTVVTLTATADSAVFGDQTVDVEVTGTGLDAADYTLSTVQITILDGQTTGTATFTVVDDAVAELNEVATISIANPSAGVALGQTVSQQVTITDDDAAAITIGDFVMDEADNGDTTFVFTITLDADVDTPVTVDFATADGTAQSADNDYTPITNGSVTFDGTAGETKTVSVVVKGDEKVERDETFVLNLTGLDAAGRNVTFTDDQATGTITNDDAASLTINDRSVAEGNSGQTAVTFTVTLDAAVDTSFTVNYSTIAGTATAGSDYTAVTNNVLTFAGNAGETQTLQVFVKGDEVAEADETFTVRLSNLSASDRDILVSDNEGVGTIVDDDGVPVVISVDTVAATEQAGTVVTITATAASTVTGNQSVDVAVSGTGITPGDYNLSAVTIPIADGQMVGTTTFTILDDAVVELDETATITLVNASVGVRFAATQSVDISIADNDAATLSVADVTVVESDTDDTILVFEVVLNNAVDAPFTVDYATADGTATVADGDYVSGTGTLTFDGTAGETQTVAVVVTGDQTVELDEMFVLDLSNVMANGRNVTIADAQAEGTIENNDAAQLWIDDVSIEEGNAGSTTFTFTVRLDAAVDGPVTVDFATNDGTAVAGDDYVASSGTGLTFSGTADETQTIQVTVNGDTTAELDETFVVDLTNIGANGRLVTIGDSQGVGTIIDDDGIKVNLGLSASAGTEAGTTVITVAATTQEAVTQDQTVQIMVTGTGVTAGDYTLSTTTITIPANQAVGLATFTIVDDLLAEDTEIAMLTLHSPSVGLSLGSVRSLPISIADNDAASLSIADVSMEEGTSGTSTVFTFTVTLNGGTGDAFTVDYATSDVSAVAGDDYTATNGRLTFSGADQETQTFTVEVNADSAIEPDEDFLVTLSNIIPTGPVITLAKAEATGTIVNDDRLAVNLAVSESSVSEVSGTVVTLTASVDTPVVGNQSVEVQVSGTGITGSDYTLSSVTINIPYGQMSGSATWSAKLDGLLEPAEVATLAIINPSSGLELGTNTSDDVVIVDHTTVVLDSVSKFPGNQPTLTWQDVPGAVGYEIWFSRIFPATTRIYSANDLTLSEWTPPETLDPAFYRYWVRAYDASGTTSFWSDSKSFEVQPTLVSPLTPTFNKRPTFEWDAIPFATSYELFVRTSSGDMIMDDLTGTTWTPTEDLPDGNIRWWVRATDATGNRGWSEVGLTSVDSRTTVLTPTGSGTDTTPLISWVPIIGAGRYILHVQNLDTDTVAIREENLTTTSYTPTTPLPAGNFRVWVKAIDAATNTFSSGLWSRGVDFSITVTALQPDATDSVPMIQLTVLPAEGSSIDAVVKQDSADEALVERPVDRGQLELTADQRIVNAPSDAAVAVASSHVKAAPVGDNTFLDTELAWLDSVMAQLPLMIE